MKERTQIAKGKSLPRGEASRLRKKPGMSSVGKYKNIPPKDFAGPKGTFPINNLEHARNALARAHYSGNPEAIRAKVYAKYPELKTRHDEREEGKIRTAKLKK
jgi:hypothetical protein